MILATSPLVGDALTQLGATHGPLVLAPFRSEAWRAHLPQAKALILLLSERLSAEEVEAARALRVVGTFSVGMDHLPLSDLRARSIAIVNTPGVLTDATADCALALLLAVSRRIREGEALVRSGEWKGWAPDQLLGTGLSGKTCGILGAGAIGQAFARRVWALGMRVVFWDRDGLGGTVSFGPDSGPRLPLKELLSQSAVLSLHCPLTPDTSGILNEDALRALPPGAIVINTARGGIVDEPALIRALHEGHIGGVGLDVYAEEPYLDRRWLQAPRTVLLPHLGSATVETRQAMAQLLCDGVRAALR
jgi:glyoxylate reductase